MPQIASFRSRFREVGEIVRPPHGWISTLREAMGLTLADLALRLKVTPPAVRSFEIAEAEDRITLRSLRRTAEALDCDLVYAFVPRGSPKTTGVAIDSSSPSPDHKPAASAVSGKVIDLTWHAQRSEL